MSVIELDPRLGWRYNDVWGWYIAEPEAVHCCCRELSEPHVHLKPHGDPDLTAEPQREEER